MIEKIKMFIYECIVVSGVSFLIGALLISAIMAGQQQERSLLEKVCQLNGQVSINGVVYECGVVDGK